MSSSIWIVNLNMFLITIIIAILELHVLQDSEFQSLP